MTRTRKFALALGVATGAALASVGGTIAQGPQDSVGAGRSGPPENFQPGYASEAGRADQADQADRATTSEYSDNAGQLEGHTASELGQEIAENECPATRINHGGWYFYNLSAGKFGETETDLNCGPTQGGRGGHGTGTICTILAKFYCDGTSWKIIQLNTGY